MKVKELIAELQNLSPDLDVCLPVSPDDGPGYLAEVCGVAVEKAGSYEYVSVNAV